MTRLTALDASFLEVETNTAHMHVGWAAVFEPPEGRPRPGFDELLAHVGGRMGRAPLPAAARRGAAGGRRPGVGGRRWLPPRAPRSPLAARRPTRARRRRHVAPASPRPAAVGAVDRRPARRRAHRDRRQGPSLHGGRPRRRRAGDAPARPDARAARAGGRRLAAGAGARPARPARRRDRGPRPGHARARDRAGAARGEPARGAPDPTVAAETGRALVDSVRPGSGNSGFTGAGSPLRHLATAHRPLDDLRRTARALGTSVNDVLLAAVAGGVRAFQSERGRSPAPLKTMVPVSVRGADGDGELGNRIAFVFVDLPCDEPDPLRRLEAAAGEMGKRKEAGEPEGADLLLLRALGYAPRTVQHLMSRLVSGERAFDLVVSNIPGPREPLWMLGCELREAYPVVPMADRHAVSIGLTTVRDEVFLGVYADRQTLPEGDRLAELIDGAFAELQQLALEPAMA